MAALNLAYSKGCIRATRKHLGRLSGLSDATVKRAVAELAEQNYWCIDHTSGGANLYTLITPNERVQLWLEDESKRKQDFQRWLNAERRAIDNWLYAEKRFAQEWLDAEKEFTQKWLKAEKRFVQDWLDAEQEAIRDWLVAEIEAQHAFETQVFNAVLDRCDDTDYAMNVAKAAWRQHQQGNLPLATALDVIAQRPRDFFPAADNREPGSGHLDTGVGPPEHRGRVSLDPGIGSPEHRGWVNPDSLNSENDRSTSTYKSDKLEVSTSHPSPTGRAPTGAPSGAAQETPSPQPAAGGQTKLGCQLCDDAGHALRLDNGEPITIGPSTDSAEWDEHKLDSNERPLMCTHSLDGNLRNLKRIVCDADGKNWDTSWTGYGEEIDGPDYD